MAIEIGTNRTQQAIEAPTAERTDAPTSDGGAKTQVTLLESYGADLKERWSKMLGNREVAPRPAASTSTSSTKNSGPVDGLLEAGMAFYGGVLGLIGVLGVGYLAGGGLSDSAETANAVAGAVSSSGVMDTILSGFLEIGGWTLLGLLAIEGVQFATHAAKHFLGGERTADDTALLGRLEKQLQP